MIRTTQRERSAGAQPLWLRLAALFCVLLVNVAGIAQAAHIHGHLLPDSAAHATAGLSQANSAGEESCPLCVAMHSALPVAGLGALLPGLLLDAHASSFVDRKPETTWYFAAFSRPPPSVTLS